MVFLLLYIYILFRCFISTKNSSVTIIRNQDYIFSFFELVTRSEIIYFQLRVSNSKVELWSFNNRVSNSKWDFLTLNFEVVTQKWKNKSLTIELVTQSEKNFTLSYSLMVKLLSSSSSNSKWNVLLCNFELLTRK